MIRLAETTDAGAIRTCAQAAFEGYVARIGRKPAPMVADPMPHILRGEVHVAIDPDIGLLGFVICWTDATEMHLDTIAVRPDMAGRGWGTRLVHHVESLARTQGARAVTLYTNAAMVENLPFYESRGYTCTGRSWQDGFDRVFFRKLLQDPRA
jgi:ribosomal protein S18 acetylase RimI-like enzyme